VLNKRGGGHDCRGQLSRNTSLKERSSLPSGHLPPSHKNEELVAKKGKKNNPPPPPISPEIRGKIREKRCKGEGDESVAVSHGGMSESTSATKPERKGTLIGRKK